MLHMSILPSHKQFERIFSNLRFVIIDEAHAYKGAAWYKSINTGDKIQCEILARYSQKRRATHIKRATHIASLACVK